jgi:hypothetical protein
MSYTNDYKERKATEKRFQGEFKKFTNKLMLRCKTVAGRRLVVLEHEHYQKFPSTPLPNTFLDYRDTVEAYKSVIKETEKH